MNRRALLLGLLALPACQAVPMEAPPMPIAWTFAASRSRFRATLVEVMLARGYALTRDTEFTLVFDRRSDALGAMILYGSSLNSFPNARIEYTITGSSPVSVAVRLLAVTNPGTAFEAISDVSQNARNRADAEAIAALLRQRLGR